MSFQELITLLKQELEHKKLEFLTIPTLGGRSKITFSINEENIKITTSNGNSYTVDPKFFEAVWNHFLRLEDDKKFEKSSYDDKNWPAGEGNPNMIFSPYLPALFKYFNL
ncbi:hypothetical protein [Algoriphagus formosus]|uniref:hypothetical protein n=1 Tax=Algoriphagus formosus TaxID=2007308 RepID=UPI000C294148|nr:hypothetical protein [Algoriphagus formosus]